MKKLLWSLLLLNSLVIKAMEKPFTEATEIPEHGVFEFKLSSHDLLRLNVVEGDLRAFNIDQRYKEKAINTLNDIFETCQKLVGYRSNWHVKGCVKSKVQKELQERGDTYNKFVSWMLTDYDMPTHIYFTYVFWKHTENFVKYLTPRNIQRGGRAAKANLAFALSKFEKPKS